MKGHTIVFLFLVVFGCSGTGETLFSGGAGGAPSSSSSASVGGMGGMNAPLVDAGQDAAEEPDAAPRLHCADMLTDGAEIGDVARLGDESAQLWQALHDACACSGICAGPCTQSLGDGRTWCADLAFVQMCSSCLASDPGCGSQRQACLDDIGGDL